MGYQRSTRLHKESLHSNSLERSLSGPASLLPCENDSFVDNQQDAEEVNSLRMVRRMETKSYQVESGCRGQQPFHNEILVVDLEFPLVYSDRLINIVVKLSNSADMPIYTYTNQVNTKIPDFYAIVNSTMFTIAFIFGLSALLLYP